MSMIGRIFRPGAGQKHKRFVAAFVNAATSFRGDLAVWDTTAPTSQGASGVLEGRTLGTTDYIYVTICPATVTNMHGRFAGVYEGKTIGDTDTTTPFPDDSCVIVQTWGVHDAVSCVQTVVTTSLLVTGTVAGEAAEVLSTDVATGVLVTNFVGVPLNADADYTRLTTTNQACCTFIRADG